MKNSEILGKIPLNEEYIGLVVFGFNGEGYTRYPDMVTNKKRYDFRDISQFIIKTLENQA